MTKSATEVMQDVIVAAVLDGMAALKAASRGVPNTMLRDISAIHANTTFADLPKELQDAITANVRAAFTRLLREGYAVAPRDLVPRVPPPAGREPRTGPPRRDRSPGGKPHGAGRGRPSKPRR